MFTPSGVCRVGTFTQIRRSGSFVQPPPHLRLKTCSFILLCAYLVQFTLADVVTARGWLHHRFVGGVLVIAIVGYPSTILPLWLLVELSELVAQNRAISPQHAGAPATVHLEY